MTIWVDMISISKVETKMKEQMNKDEDRKLKLTVIAPNSNPNHLHPPGHQQQQQHHSTRPHSPSPPRSSPFPHHNALPYRAHRHWYVAVVRLDRFDLYAAPIDRATEGRLWGVGMIPSETRHCRSRRSCHITVHGCSSDSRTVLWL